MKGGRHTLGAKGARFRNKAQSMCISVLRHLEVHLQFYRTLRIWICRVCHMFVCLCIILIHMFIHESHKL